MTGDAGKEGQQGLSGESRGPLNILLPFPVTQLRLDMSLKGLLRAVPLGRHHPYLPGSSAQSPL